MWLLDSGWLLLESWPRPANLALREACDDVLLGFFFRQNLGSHRRAFRQLFLLDVQAMPVNAGLSRLLGRIATVPDHACLVSPLQAMFVDFGMARQYDGVCLLRFDDTNPEAEKQVGTQQEAINAVWVEGWSCVASECVGLLRVGSTRSPAVEEQVGVWHWFGQHLHMDGCASCSLRCAAPHGAAISG